ncbi:MAG: pyrimidine dimer DNA glycosylase/endonuclease V [Bacteroidota bacterium]
MRLWSIHPKYLDAKGLVALWREALLAKKVLRGRTKGYKHHPQLNRFKNSPNPLHCINQYLSAVYHEAVSRNYAFDKRKINWKFVPLKLKVTKGQVAYERTHLLKKLNLRDPLRYKEFKKEITFKPHPMFRVVKGGIEEWEVR